MKLTHKHDFTWGSNPKRVYEIDDAVERSLHSDADGAVERVKDEVQAAGEMMGRLLKRLHEKGLFDDADVLAVLAYGFEIEGKEESDDDA